jgi:hypothetical protein
MATLGQCIGIILVAAARTSGRLGHHTVVGHHRQAVTRFESLTLPMWSPMTYNGYCVVITGIDRLVHRPGRTIMVGFGVAGVAKKKDGSELKTATVKIDRTIVTRAKVLAADRGETVAAFLSDLLRAPVDREWSKMVRKASGGE